MEEKEALGKERRVNVETPRVEEGEVEEEGREWDGREREGVGEEKRNLEGTGGQQRKEGTSSTTTTRAATTTTTSTTRARATQVLAWQVRLANTDQSVLALSTGQVGEGSAVGLTIAYGGGELGEHQLHHPSSLHKRGGAGGLSPAATHFPFLLPPERAHSPCPPFYHTESTRRNGLLDLPPIQERSTWLQNWTLNFPIPSFRFSRTLGRSRRSSDRPNYTEYGSTSMHPTPPSTSSS